ncbi:MULTISPECIES: GNAT family N-acetyltransferase [Bacillaceae]|uniref:GNAT family N-acetyltransferase n=1 Tax=Bacillaceae TaxID=186817 RepID=UPI0006AE1A58|nr:MULTISPECIES: GNAT family N-acetyltransferase [Bacillaceae]ALC84478.1 GCN5 family acetyltransferase [Bacillus sp. FJAT-22090]KQL33276.1 GCN5 family acetyltransferase [Psychrobacillus sp. FJAT-21963]
MRQLNEKIDFRAYVEDDFESIHLLNIQEEWNNLVAKKEDTKNAWSHSNVAFVASANGRIIGYIRGITDGYISLLVCELVIDQNYRGLGIGTDLLKYVHNLFPKTRMELLASSSSRTYYEGQEFRNFYGYRKTFEEW